MMQPTNVVFKWDRIGQDLRTYAWNFPNKISFRRGWLAILFLGTFVWMWRQLDQLPIPLFWTGFVFQALLLFFVRPLYDLMVAVNVMRLGRFTAVADRLFLLAEYLFLVKSMGEVALGLSYLMAAWNFPLVDVQLSHADRALGFDWVAFAAFSQRPFVRPILAFAYHTIYFQTLLLAVWITFRHGKQKLYEIFWIILVTILVTSFISGICPAYGPAYALGAAGEVTRSFSGVKDAFADITAIRAGSHSMFHGLIGIITFPSFHTVCSLVFMYAFGKSGWLSIFIRFLNILMIVSIPFNGDHYLVDMLAGSVVAAASIFLIINLCRSRNQIKVSHAAS